MDVVIVDKLALKGAEGVETDVERHDGSPHAGRLQRRQQLGSEVQAGGGGRGRARRARVDRLVPIGRRGAVMDVGRKWHLAGSGHDRVRVAVEADRTGAVAQPLPHLEVVATGEGQDGTLGKTS